MGNKQLAEATMAINAPVEQVAEWIVDPDKVLLYAPNPVSGGVFDAGQRIWIRLKTGVTMLERVSERGEVCPLTIRVTASSLKSDPTCAEDVYAKRLMTFYEDWFLNPSSEGTEITKVWRNLEKHKLWFIPFGLLISMAAKQDAPRLETAWNGLGARSNSATA